MRPFRLFGTICILAVALQSHAAQAMQWRFCIGADVHGHRIALSEIFPSEKDSAASAAAFDAYLSRSGVVHDIVQCPQGGARSAIQQDLAHARQFNEDLGYRVEILKRFAD